MNKNWFILYKSNNFCLQEKEYIIYEKLIKQRDYAYLTKYFLINQKWEFKRILEYEEVCGEKIIN